MAKYNVTTKKGKKVFGETFNSKKEAQQSIVDAIKGGSNQNAMKYINYSVRKTK